MKTAKHCPFCGCVPHVKPKSPDPRDSAPDLAWCKNEDCVIWDLSMSLKDWNRRPVQDKLESALIELAAHAAVALKQHCTEYRYKWHRMLTRAFNEAYMARGLKPPKL